MTRVKLCGLMSAEDAAAANRCRPDYAGMILSSGFRRSVTAQTAEQIRSTLFPEIPAVGVFVNASVEEIAGFADRGIIQYVQLHGTEDNSYIRLLRQRCQCPVIKAFRITGPEDLHEAEQSKADLILLDSGTGTGIQLDWHLLTGFQRPYLLAGGLTPENAETAVSMLHPFGVDVSSGIETNGRKDADKMLRFTDTVRSTAQTVIHNHDVDKSGGKT